MVNSSDAEDVAAEIRQGYETGGFVGAAEAWINRLADVIDVWHRPAAHWDGPMSSEAFSQLRRNELAAFQKALPDYEESGILTVDGDEVLHEMTMSGTVKGRRVTAVIPCKWTVRDGRIVSAGSYASPEAVATGRALMEVLAPVMPAPDKA